MASDVKFTGFDEVRRMVDPYADELGYAVLGEVLDRTHRKALVRIDLSPGALEGFLDHADEHNGQEATPAVVSARLCRALLARVQAEVTTRLPARGSWTYMLRLYQPKGGYLKSRCFEAERVSEVAPGRTLPAPLAEAFTTPSPGVPAQQLIISVPLNPDLLPEARVWRALGAAVEAFVGTVVRTTGELVDAQQRVIEQQAEQLLRSWRIIEALTQQLQFERAERSQGVPQHRTEAGARRTLDALVSALFGGLQELGQVLQEQRGADTPELAEVFALFARSPELARALPDPAGRASLQGEQAQAQPAQTLLEPERGAKEGDAQ